MVKNRVKMIRIKKIRVLTILPFTVKLVTCGSRLKAAQGLEGGVVAVGGTKLLLPTPGPNEGLHAGTGGHTCFTRGDPGSGQGEREEAEEHGGRDDPAAGGRPGPRRAPAWGSLRPLPSQPGPPRGAAGSQQANVSSGLGVGLAL